MVIGVLTTIKVFFKFSEIKRKKEFETRTEGARLMTLHVDFFSSPKLTISKPIDFKSTLCSFVQFRNHLFVIKSTKISSHRKAERLLFFLFNSTLVFKLLSCLKATSPFCRLKGKFLQTLHRSGIIVNW